jgi:hypothetical protein
MGISMKQTHQSGEELDAFVNEINNYKNIKKVILVITDYLHRHYVQLEGNKSLEKAGNDAEKMGEVWIQDNIAILNKIPVEKLQIIKWKSLIDDDSFKDCLSKVKEYYNTENFFKNLVNVYSINFGNKYFNQLHSNGTTLEACILAAKNYFLEESAIILKFISFKFDVMTYPGECNPGINFIYKKSFGKPLNFIAYRFRNAGEGNKFFTDSIKNQEEKNTNESYQLKKNI